MNLEYGLAFRQLIQVIAFQNIKSPVSHRLLINYHTARASNFSSKHKTKISARFQNAREREMREIVSINSFFFRGDDSDPIATVDEIRRRLQRPIPSPPPPPSRLPTIIDLQPHDSIENERDSERKEEKKRRLDDYLDSKLLSVISSKMKGDRREGEKKQRIAEFEWPTKELRELSEDGRRDCIDGAVNLDNNLEAAVKEDGVRGKGSCSSPFSQFEETVLTLFDGR